MLRFRRMRSMQNFVAVHASVSNNFSQEYSLSCRTHFKLNRTVAFIIVPEIALWLPRLLMPISAQ